MPNLLDDVLELTAHLGGVGHESVVRRDDGRGEEKVLVVVMTDGAAPPRRLP